MENKVLYVKSEPGLGNTLFYLINAIVDAEKKKIKYHLGGKVSKLLLSKRSKLNDNIKKIRYVASYHDEFKYFSLEPSILEDFDKAVNQITFKKFILDEVDLFSKNFNDKTISIHIRSWFSSVNRKSNNKKAERRANNSFNLKTHIDEMNKYPEANFFVAVDNFDLKDKLRDIFGKRIITYPRNDKFHFHVNDFIEMLLLGRTKKFIGFHESTFTKCAFLFRKNCQEVTTILKDKIMHHSINSK